MPLKLDEIAETLANAGVSQSFCFAANEYASFKERALSNIARGYTTALITSVTTEPKFPAMNFNEMPYVVDVYVLVQEQETAVVSIYSPNINDKARKK